MRQILIAVVCLSAAVSTNAAPEPPTVCQNGMAPTVPQPIMPDLTGRLPAPDILDIALDCARRALWTHGDPNPDTAWSAAYRKRYSRILGKTPINTLVVPVQTQAYGFDWVERALITEQIAETASALGLKIADPALVTAALGNVARRINFAQVSELAQKMGVSRVLVSYAGHNAQYRMTFTLQDYRCNAQKICNVVGQKDWRALPFSHELPPFAVLHAKRQEIASWLAGKSVSVPERTTYAPTSNTFPWSPQQVAAGTVTTDAASVGLLLSALAPLYAETTRKQLWVRTLRQLLAQDPRSTGRAWRLAYAYQQLERRPLALAQVAKSAQPADIVMRELLNGNLPEARKAVLEVVAPFDRLLLEINVQDLIIAYKKEREFDTDLAQHAFESAADHWNPLLEARLHDRTSWPRIDHIAIKQLWDHTFPHNDLTLETVMTGVAVARDQSANSTVIALANLAHGRRAIDSLTAPRCCAAIPTTHAWSMAWFLEAQSEANLLNEIEFQHGTQGQPQNAKVLADQVKTVLSGKPDFEYVHTNMLSALAERLGQAGSAGVTQDFIDSKKRRGLSMQGQSVLTLFARETHMGWLGDVYGTDWPSLPFWLSSRRGIQPVPESIRQQTCEASTNSVRDLESVTLCIQFSAPTQQPAMVAALAGRFHGHPYRAQLAALAPSSASGAGATVNKSANLLAALKGDPENWDNYLALGRYYVYEQLDNAAAQKMFLSYPGLQPARGANRVGLANEAYEAGSLLFWIGHPELAAPLYKISADLNTGADSSLSSAARLNSMSGDYMSAMMLHRERALRYESEYGFRDFLSFLHAFGGSDEAWAAFQQVVGQYDKNMQIWVSALTAQRKANLSPAALRQWLMQPPISELVADDFALRSTYALWWFTTDRENMTLLVPLMAELDKSLDREVEFGGVNVRRGNHSQPVSFKLNKTSAWRIGRSKLFAAGSKIKSEYLLFAEGYAALRAKDYAKAHTSFVAFADHYEVERFDTAFAMPYLAWAASKTDDKLEFEKFIESYYRGVPSYDLWLTRAFFAIGRRDANAALNALRHALPLRPYTETRPVLTEYQWSEACEYAWQETRDSRFKTALLDWAIQHQTIQPTHAWAYALEAQYAADGPRRVRAVAMTMFLDPASERLSRLPAALLVAGRAELKRSPPFAPPKSKPAGETTAM